MPPQVQVRAEIAALIVDGLDVAAGPEAAGFAPATSSAPFVATLVDVTCLVIYFSVAYAFLSGVML